MSLASTPSRGFDYAAAIQACGKQDANALRQVYDLEAGAMLGVAIRIVRRRDLAEEVVHDAFMQIWRKAHQFDPALGSGRSWIYAIVRNKALNLVRDRSREDLVDGEDLDALVEGADHAGIISELPERDALRLCLERLEPPRRTSILLAYVEGFSHGEIAGRLGVPLGTVKAWIRRSLLALKECMA